MSQVPCHYRIKPCKIYQKIPLEQPGTWSYHSWSTSVLPVLSELHIYIYCEIWTSCRTVLQMITHRGTHVLLGDSFYCVDLLINLLMLCVCVSVCAMCLAGKRGKWIYGGWRRTRWHWFYRLTAWVPGIELKTWGVSVHWASFMGHNSTLLIRPSVCPLRGKIKHPSTKRYKT